MPCSFARCWGRRNHCPSQLPTKAPRIGVGLLACSLQAGGMSRHAARSQVSLPLLLTAFSFFFSRRHSYHTIAALVVLPAARKKSQHPIARSWHPLSFRPRHIYCCKVWTNLGLRHDPSLPHFIKCPHQSLGCSHNRAPRTSPPGDIVRLVFSLI